MDFKRKRLLPAGLTRLALVLAAAGAVAAGALAGPQPSPPPASVSYAAQAEEKELTILLYMVGADLEREGQAATENLQELVAARLPGDEINLVGEAGGTNGWHTEGFAAAANTRFTVSEAGIAVQQSLPQRNMGESSTLADFVRYGRASYPARRTFLVLWNHGDGPTGGFGSDERYGGDSLLPAELATALDWAGCKTAPLELVGFDACCMANLETALSLAPYAKYMLASQEVEPGGGWDYSCFARLAGLPAPKAAQAIAQAYLAKYGDVGFALTASVTDLSRLEPLALGVEALAQGLAELPFEQLAPLRRDVLCFGGMDDARGFSDSADLAAFAKAMEPLCPEAAEQINAGLAQAVLWSAPTQAAAGCGLTLYAPYCELEQIAQRLENYNLAPPMPHYAAFASRFANWLGQQHTGLMQPALYQREDEVWAALPQEALQSLHSAYFTLWEQDEAQPDYYYMVGTDSDVQLEESTVRYAYSDLWTFLGGEPLCTLELESPAGLYTRFACPALVNGRRTNLILQYDRQYPYGRVLFAVGVTENDLPSKELWALEKGDEITPLYPVAAFGGEEDTPEPPPYKSLVEGYKVGNAFVYDPLLEPMEGCAGQNSLYGFWFLTLNGENYYSDFWAVS